MCPTPSSLSPSFNTHDTAPSLPLLNPVAIGALHALAQLGDTVGRVAIVDVSARHGDGTEEIVRGYPQVGIDRWCIYVSREGGREG